MPFNPANLVPISEYKKPEASSFNPLNLVPIEDQPPPGATLIPINESPFDLTPVQKFQQKEYTIGETPEGTEFGEKLSVKDIGKAQASIIRQTRDDDETGDMFRNSAAGTVKMFDDYFKYQEKFPQYYQQAYDQLVKEKLGTVKDPAKTTTMKGERWSYPEIMYGEEHLEVEARKLAKERLAGEGLIKPAKTGLSTLKEIVSDPKEFARRLPFIGGGIETQEALELLSAIKDAKNGTADEEDYQLLIEAQMLAEREGNFWALVAEIATQLPGYAIEFLFTAGTASAGKEVVKRSAREAVNWMLKKQGRKIIKEGAEKFGLRAVQGAVGTTAGALARTVDPRMWPRIMANTSKQLLPDFEINKRLDDQIEVVSEELKPFGDALSEGFMLTFTENLGEQFGDTFGFAGKELTKFVKANPKSVVSGVIKAIIRKNPKVPPEKIMQGVRQAGIHSVPVEIFEERVTDFLQSGIEGHEFKWPTPEEWLAEIVAIGGFAGGARVIGSRLDKRTVKKQEKAKAKGLKAIETGQLRQLTDQEVADFARSLTAEERMEVGKDFENIGNVLQREKIQELAEFQIQKTRKEETQAAQQQAKQDKQVTVPETGKPETVTPETMLSGETAITKVEQKPQEKKELETPEVIEQSGQLEVNLQGEWIPASPGEIVDGEIKTFIDRRDGKTYNAEGLEVRYKEGEQAKAKADPLIEEAKKYKTAEEFVRADFQNKVIAGQDFIDEVKSVNRKKTINPDGTVTIYHGTDKGNIEKIKNEGLRSQSFLSLTKGETIPHIQQIKDKEVIPMKVDVRDVEFSSGTQEVYAPDGLVLDKDGVWKSPERAKSQLTDIWNKANKPKQPTPVEVKPTIEKPIEEKPGPTLPPKTVESLSIAKLDPKTIKIDETKFQPKEQYREGIIESIANDYDPVEWEEPLLWKEPETGNLLVVRGHHRQKGVLKGNITNVSYKILPEGTTLEEAQKYAKSEKRDVPTDLENASTIRERHEAGESITQIAKDMPQIAPRAKTDLSRQAAVRGILNLGYLDTKGKFRENYESTNEFPRIIGQAKSIGAYRRKYPWITDRHEDDIFTYLYTENGIKGDMDVFDLGLIKTLERMDQMSEEERPERLIQTLRKDVLKPAEDTHSEILQEIKDLQGHIDVLNRQLDDPESMKSLVKTRMESKGEGEVKALQAVKRKLEDRRKEAKRVLLDKIAQTHKPDESQSALFEPLYQYGMFGGGETLYDMTPTQEREQANIINETKRVKNELDLLAKQYRNKVIKPSVYYKQWEKLKSQENQLQKRQSKLDKQVKEKHLKKPIGEQEGLFEPTAPYGTDAFKKWFGGSKVVDENGDPLVAYHGSPSSADIEMFKYDPRDGGEDASGIGFYFTSSPSEASGYSDVQIDPRKQGTKKSPGILPVYISIKNPIILEGQENILDAKELDFNSDQAYEIIKHSPDIYDYDNTSVWNWMDISGYDKVEEWMIRDVAESYKGSYWSIYNDHFKGEQQAFVTAIEKVLGYDGVIRTFPSETPMGRKMEKRSHYIPFKPTQIKSAIGNVGTFDPTDPSILADPAIPYGKKDTFFSKALRVVRDKFSNKMASMSVVNWLKKNQVKDEEIYWLDIKGLTEGKKHVTREELLEWINSHEITVTEVMKGVTPPDAVEPNMFGEMTVLVGDNQPKHSQYQLEGEREDYRELLLTLPVKKKLVARKRGGFWSVYNQTDNLWNKTVFENKEHAERFIKESEDYHLTISGKPLNQDPFKSPHFDEPNILAHIRFNTRYDADGNKVLFIEEFQSDWQMKGLDEGFARDGNYTVKDVFNIKVIYGEKSFKNKQYVEFDVGNEFMSSHYVAEIKENQTKEDAIQERLNQLNKSLYFYPIFQKKKGISPAPFVSDKKGEASNEWIRLALKRMMRYGAENGFDKIAWTTGRQQIDRWQTNLRQNVDKIHWQRKSTNNVIATPEGFEGPRGVWQVYDARRERRIMGGLTEAGAKQTAKEMNTAPQYVKINTFKDGKNTGSMTVPLEGETTISGTKVTLDRLLGKPMANKIRNSEKRTGTFEGDNLSIGGGVHKYIYDNAMPSIAKKLGKQFGAKVGETLVKTRHTTAEMPNEKMFREASSNAHDAGDTRSGLLLRNEADALAMDPTIDTPGWIVNPNEPASKYINELRKEIPPGTLQPSIDITDGMKQSVLQGQEIFEPIAQLGLDFPSKQQDIFRKDATEEEKELGETLQKEVSRHGLVRNRRSGFLGTLRGNAITTPLLQGKTSSVIGHRIRSAEELATAIQIYRDPRYETLRIFFTQKDRIVGHTAISSRLPGTVQGFNEIDNIPYLQWLRYQQQKVGADGFWLSHNHPSGQMKTSDDDMNFTRNAASQLPGFKGHIIIDGNQYVHIRFAEKTHIVDYTVHDKYFGEDKLLVASKKHPYLNRTAYHPDHFADIAKELQSSDHFTLIGINSLTKIAGVYEIPHDFHNLSKARKIATLRHYARQTGSIWLIAVDNTTKFNNEYNQLASEGALTDAIGIVNGEIVGYVSLPPRKQLLFTRDRKKIKAKISEPAKSYRSKALSRAHILEKELGLSKDEAVLLKSSILDMETLAEASDKDIDTYINYLIEQKTGKPPIEKPKVYKKTVADIRKEREESDEARESRLKQWWKREHGKPFRVINQNLIESMDHALQNKFGKAGKELHRKLTDAELNKEEWVKPNEVQLEQLGKKVPHSEMNIMRDLIENGGAEGMSKPTKEFINWWNKLTQDVFDKGSKYINEDLKYIDNYFPLVLRPDFYTNMNPQHERWDEVVKHVQKILTDRIGWHQQEAFSLGITFEKAEEYVKAFIDFYNTKGLREHFLQQVFQPPGEFKHSYPLELHRDRIFPEWAYETDVMNVAHAYIDKSYTAIAYAKHLQKIDEEYKYEGVEELLDQIEQEGFDRNTAADMTAWVMQLKQMNEWEQTLVGVAKNVTSFLLSWKTSIRNLGDVTKAFAYSGNYSTMESFVKQYVFFNHKERQMAKDLIGSKYVFTQTLQDVGLGGKAATFWSRRVIAFTASEGFVRKIAGDSATLSAKHLLKNYEIDGKGRHQKYIKRQLDRLTDGLDIDFIKKRGHFTRSELLRIGNIAIRAQQPATKLAKPRGWESNSFIAASTIFKSFGHRGFRYLKDYVLKELFKHGNARPLITFVLWRAALGYGIEEVFKFLFPKNYDEEEEAVKKLWEVFLETGEFGILTDLVFAVRHAGWLSPIISMVFGPAFAVGIETIWNLSKTAHRIGTGKDDPTKSLKRQAARYTVKRLPLVGEDLYEKAMTPKKLSVEERRKRYLVKQKK